MSDEIFQLKPNVYGIGIDLLALGRRMRRTKGESGGPATLASRFLRVFKEHGVLATGIPDFIPVLRYSDLLEERALLAALTPDIMKQAADLFAVRLAWLLGTDDVIYETDYCYKSPRRLLDRLEGVARDPWNMPLRAISTSRQLDKQSVKSQRLELVIAEPISTNGERTIYRYHPFADGWEWRYSECRIQLKAMVRALRRPVPLYEVSQAEIDLAYCGSLFFGQALRGSLVTAPSLEDYAMTSSESRQAKEVDEIPFVSIYVRENGLSRGLSLERSE